MSTTGLPEAPEDREGKAYESTTQRGERRTRNRPMMQQQKARKLQERAKILANKAKSKVRIYFMVTEDIYEVLLELCEEFSDAPMSVARKAFIDGMRKYRDFRTPYDYENPLAGKERTQFRHHEPGRPPKRGIIDRTGALLDHDANAEYEDERGREDAEDQEVKNFVTAVEDRTALRGFIPSSATAPRKAPKVAIDYGAPEVPLEDFNKQPNISEMAEE